MQDAFQKRPAEAEEDGSAGGAVAASVATATHWPNPGSVPTLSRRWTCTHEYGADGDEFSDHESVCDVSETRVTDGVLGADGAATGSVTATVTDGLAPL